jgi:hypothetical protein
VFLKRLEEPAPGHVPQALDVHGMAEAVRLDHVRGVRGAADRRVVLLAAAAGVDDERDPELLPDLVQDPPHLRVEGVQTTAAAAAERLLREVVPGHADQTRSGQPLLDEGQHEEERQDEAGPEE